MAATPRGDRRRRRLLPPARSRRPHLRIAPVVGIILTAINESGPIAHGRLGVGTWFRIALNFVVPFIVSNVGLLSGRPR
jgi:hypothetical protein